MDYKRINQLNQVFSAGNSDVIPIDIVDSTETQKITKQDFLSSYITDVPNTPSTSNWIWARKNGTWTKILPDDYVTEAPEDGRYYVRVNGQWVYVTNVSGDMLASVYDINLRGEDIYNYVLEKTGAFGHVSDSVLNQEYPQNEISDSVVQDFTLGGTVIPIVEIFGTTLETKPIADLPRTFDNKSTFSGIENLTVTGSEKNAFSLGIEIGTIIDNTNKEYFHTTEPIALRDFDNEDYQGIELLGIQKVPVDLNGVPDEKSNYFLLNCHVNEEISNLENVDKYVLGKTTSKKWSKTFQFAEPIYGINNEPQKSDFVLIETNEDTGALSYLLVRKTLLEVLNGTESWLTYSGANTVVNNTYAFSLAKNMSASDASEIYGDADSLISIPFENFDGADYECISFYNGKIYVRLTYTHLGKELGDLPENYLASFKNFLVNHNVNIVYNVDESSTPLSSDAIAPFCGQSFTTIQAYTTIDSQNLKRLSVLASFNPLVNQLVTKVGGEVKGGLYVYGPNGKASIHEIEGIEENSKTPSALYINKNNQNPVYVNGANRILDLRDFTDNLTWSPKAKTIGLEETDDLRVVNVNFLKANYAKLNSPNFTGVPTSTKASTTGTSQIATGEFISDFYYSKTQVDSDFVKATDGTMYGAPTLRTLIEENPTDLKRLLNIEFLRNFYLTSATINQTYAPLDSPNLTGNPTAPTPDESLSTQIANVNYVLSNYFKKTGGPIYGNIEILNNENVSQNGDLLVAGLINIAKKNEAQNLLNNNKALITDANSNIVASEVTATELNTLSGITGNVQAQIDNIPKYTYLSGLIASISAESWPAQSTIDASVIPVIQAAYPSPSEWNAVTVAVTLSPSDKKRDILYYYNAGHANIAAGWYYLYDLSTSINRANGSVAGIVENSTNGDISFSNGYGVVNHATKADKFTTSVKINQTPFDGSSDITTPIWGIARTISLGQELSGSVSINGGVDKTLNASYVVHNIADGTDLNTLLTIGKYSCPYIVNAHTLLNCPTTQAFGMTVESSGAGIVQRITEFLVDVPKIYFRNKYRDTFGSWFREYTTYDKPTTTEIGAATAAQGAKADALVSGSTPAGNASKLGGALPSAYATAAQGAKADNAIQKDGSVAMTAQLLLSGNPTSNLGAATKQYVDNAMATGGSVKSVNGQLPDGTGNIELDIVDKAERLAAVVQLGNADFDGSESVTAEQMGVRPDTWVPTLEEVGAEPAFTKNNAFNKSFGSAAGTVCQGNDTRLSNSRRASNITMSYNGNLWISYS